MIREAVASGHGVGKSALAGFVINWALSTMPDTRIIITANTEPQLKTKTWPEVIKWQQISHTHYWFKSEATSIFSMIEGKKHSWRCDRITWNENNPQAFAGLHNKGKRIVLIFDEASEIHEKIWEVSEGALTDEDTEIIWLAFGNPTENAGGFYDCFHTRRHRWGNLHLDAREIEGTNKEFLQSIVDDYGEDSDRSRVRVRGLFPHGSSLQYIPHNLVYEAQTREARCNIDDPLIASLDIARGGEDNCVLRYRRGLDARSIPPVVVAGSEVHDSMKLVSIVSESLKEHKPDAFFFDGVGVGGPVGDRMKQLGFNVIEVKGGAKSPDDRYFDMNAFMWYKVKQWFLAGGAIDQSPVWDCDFKREYGHNSKDQLVMESKKDMKKRGLPSCDHADALAMTFAYPVALLGEYAEGVHKVKSNYDPYAEERL